MGEAMDKALHDADFLVDDLNECLDDATGADSIAIGILLMQAADLAQGIRNLKAAMEGADL